MANFDLVDVDRLRPSEPDNAGSGRKLIGFADYREFVIEDDDVLPSQCPDEHLASDWTLVQALTWAAHGTPAWARRLAPWYLKMKPKVPLAPVDVASARNLLILQRWQGERSPPEEADEQAAFIDPPWNGLWEALGSGDLKATGHRWRSDDRIDIRADFWQDVDRLGPYEGPHDAVGVFSSKGLTEVSFAEVRVRRDDVIRIWPSDYTAIPVTATLPAEATSTRVVRKIAPKRPGPRPVKTLAVRERMLRDVENGRFSLQALDDMTDAALEAEYGASATLVSDVRDQVVATARNSEKP